MALYKGCEGIICGHIHQPAIKHINGIHYLNSGDWVESMTALVEDKKGEWSLVYYSESNQKEKDESDEKTIPLHAYTGNGTKEVAATASQA